MMIDATKLWLDTSLNGLDRLSRLQLCEKAETYALILMFSINFSANFDEVWSIQTDAKFLVFVIGVQGR